MTRPRDVTSEDWRRAIGRVSASASQKAALHALFDEIDYSQSVAVAPVYFTLISKRAGLSRRALHDAVHFWVDLGVVRFPAGRVGGKGVATRVGLSLDALEQLPAWSLDGQEVRRVGDVTGVHAECARRDASVTPNVADRPPKGGKDTPQSWQADAPKVATIAHSLIRSSNPELQSGTPKARVSHKARTAEAEAEETRRVARAARRQLLAETIGTNSPLFNAAVLAEQPTLETLRDTWGKVKADRSIANPRKAIEGMLRDVFGVKPATRIQ